jgi:DNA-binding transcriptional LysR family regulator
MHSLNWDDLQVFLAVARTGRLSGAARRLQVEHTTIARRLAALETELGVPLFYRTTSGCLLTSHGQNVLSNAEAMERAAVAVTVRAREGSAIAGRVRIALPPEFASHWLVPRLPEFRSAYPQIDLQILVGTRQRDLSRGEAELAVQSPHPRQQSVVAVKIGRTAAALYALKPPPGHKPLRVDSADAGKPLPLLTYLPSFQMLQDAKWFQPLLASANVVIETNSTHALLAAVRAGIGIGVLPRFIAKDQDDLVQVSDNVASTEVWLITHPEFRRDPKVRATADFLKRIATGPEGLC